MKSRIVETLKTLLIILLFCTLLLLTAAAMPMDMIRSTPWLSSVLQPLSPLLGLPQAELAYVEDAQSGQDAAQPLRVSVRNSAGRSTAQWNFTELDASYEMLGGLLGQALDTAGEFTEISDRKIIQALSAHSVCFEFGLELPVSLLGSWLGAEQPATDAAGQRFILAVEQERVQLYLGGSSCLTATTELSAEVLNPLLEQFMPDGSLYAFETDNHLADLALIPGSDPMIPAVVSSSPCDSRYVEALATALGFNPYDETRYTDSLGATWFSETNCSLQIAASGEILLTSTSADRFLADDDTIGSLVEYAAELVNIAVGDVLGDARIYLSGLTQEQEQTTLTFDYIFGGIPVSCAGNPAATICFTGRTMTSLELVAASFAAMEEPLRLLPSAQVSAIAPAGSDLVLRYDRAANGEMTAGWVRTLSRG